MRDILAYKQSEVKVKKAEIVQKLGKHLNRSKNKIILEVLEGKPESKEGGVWLDADIDDMEKLTEDVNFDRKISGWAKYLDKWSVEGLITEKERTTGKS